MSPGPGGAGAEPPAVNIGGAGDIDMYPEPTSRAIAEIRRAGDGWGKYWPLLRAAIARDERTAQTGFDAVSRNFREGYNQVVPSLRPRADEFGPKLTDAAERGENVVKRYVESFQDQADVMRPE